MENNNITEITDCERLVMLVIWDASEDLSMQEICTECNQRFDKNWTTQTASTFLARLRQRNYLSMKRNGRTFYYTPLVTKQAYIENYMPQLLKLLGISRENILSSNWLDWLLTCQKVAKKHPNKDAFLDYLYFFSSSSLTFYVNCDKIFIFLTCNLAHKILCK